jgi:hypothetical protein
VLAFFTQSGIQNKPAADLIGAVFQEEAPAPRQPGESYSRLATCGLLIATRVRHDDKNGLSYIPMWRASPYGGVALIAWAREVASSTSKRRQSLD